jgi:hypothetical protein
MKHMIIAAALLLASAPAFAAKQDKADICHFDLDYGVWKLISISGNTVEKHFENHDDGLPGGATLGTETSLDSNCEVLISCPCWSQVELRAIADLSFTCFGGGLPGDEEVGLYGVDSATGSEDYAGAQTARTDQCRYAEQTPSYTSRTIFTDPETTQVCIEEIRNECARRSGQ